MRQSRAKKQVRYRIEVIELTTTDAGTTTRSVLIQERNVINLPAIINAVNDL